MEILYTFESVTVLWQLVLIILTTCLLFVGGMFVQNIATSNKNTGLLITTSIFLILTFFAWFTIPFMDGFRTTYYQVKAEKEQDIDMTKYKIAERRGATFIIKRR